MATSMAANCLRRRSCMTECLPVVVVVLLDVFGNICLNARLSNRSWLCRLWERPASNSSKRKARTALVLGAICVLAVCFLDVCFLDVVWSGHLAPLPRSLVRVSHMIAKFRTTISPLPLSPAKTRRKSASELILHGLLIKGPGTVPRDHMVMAWVIPSRTSSSCWHAARNWR